MLIFDVSQKHKIKMNKSKTPLIISKSKIDSDFFIDIIIPIGLLGFVLYLFLFKDFEITRSYSLALIGLIAFTFYRLIKRLKNRKQIIIDSIGIKLLEENKVFLWKEIQYAFINENGLQVITKRNNTIKSLEGLKFSAEAIEKAIIEYSGRDIANYTKYRESEIISIIGDNNISDEIIKKIKRFNNYQSLIGTLVFFGIIGISIYFQVTSIDYSIGFGFVLLVLLIPISEKVSFENFKKYLSEFQIPDEKIKELAIKNRIILDKKKEIFFAIVFFSLITIAVFIITYFFLNE